MPHDQPNPDPPGPQPTIAPEHQQRLVEILAELGALGFCLPGSVAERRLQCTTPGCHCHADPAQRHGPYIAWTRKLNRKTVAHNLTPDQAQRYGPWFANNQRLRQLTSELQALSLQAAAEAEGWGEK